MKCINKECHIYNNNYGNCDDYSAGGLENCEDFIPEKSCNNCEWNRSDEGIFVECQHPGPMINCVNYSNWKPKEDDKMEKKGITETDAKYIYYNAVRKGIDISEFKSILKDVGIYIKKSKLEIAREEYNKYTSLYKGFMDKESGEYRLIDILWSAILELERLKSENKGG